jgi:Predicted N-acetylglucosamine kinase
MKIIADSGATKVDWRIIFPDQRTQQVTTVGINAVFLTKEEIVKILKEQLRSAFEGEPAEIYFYAAGITGPEMEAHMQACFKEVFPLAQSAAYSDIVAAVRALCGKQPGIAAIMGTGSNTCFYDGESIAPDKVPAGGFILGDEGGGAVLGRKLLADFMKRQLPKDVEADFKATYPEVDLMHIIQKVYRESIPSRFLASFSPFLNKHRNNPHINHLLRSSFAEFFSRNIAQYDYKHYEVNIVGSIAYYYKDLLVDEAQKQGMRIGKILQAPIDGLLDYHI